MQYVGVRALLAQLESVLRDPPANAARAAEALAAHPEADIAVFPELFLGAYDLRALDETARPVDCDELATVAAAAAAAGTAVVIGFAERNDDGSCSNSVACIDRDGSLAGVYRKTQLYAGRAEGLPAGTGAPPRPARRSRGRAADLLRRRVPGARARARAARGRSCS